MKELIKKWLKIKTKIAISIGDLNGIGIEIALKCHEEISNICQPIYCNNKMLKKASNEKKIPKVLKYLNKGWIWN